MNDIAFSRVLRLAEFPETGVASVSINGWTVLVARVGDRFHALNNRCSHAAATLSGGRLRHGTIMCPLHGARFDLASGKCLGGAYSAVRRFDVREDDGWIAVAVPDEPPGINERPVT